jgi:hypothetical protein
MGMKTSRARSALEVALSGGTTVCFSEENGQLARRLRFGPVPFCRAMASTLVGGMASVSFILSPTNPFTAVLVFAALLGLVADMRGSAKVERLQEKLFDRAYDIDKSTRMAP